MQIPFQFWALSLVLLQLGGSVTLGAFSEMEHLATHGGERHLANLSQGGSSANCPAGGKVCVKMGSSGCVVKVTDGCFAGPFSVDWQMNLIAVAAITPAKPGECLYLFDGKSLTLKGGRVYTASPGSGMSVFVPGSSEASDHFGCTIRIVEASSLGKRLTQVDKPFVPLKSIPDPQPKVMKTPSLKAPEHFPKMPDPLHLKVEPKVRKERTTLFLEDGTGDCDAILRGIANQGGIEEGCNRMMLYPPLPYEVSKDFYEEVTRCCNQFDKSNTGGENDFPPEACANQPYDVAQCKALREDAFEKADENAYLEMVRCCPVLQQGYDERSGCGPFLDGIAVEGDVRKGCATLLRYPPFEWEPDQLFYDEVKSCCSAGGTPHRGGTPLTCTKKQTDADCETLRTDMLADIKEGNIGTAAGRYATTFRCCRGEVTKISYTFYERKGSCIGAYQPIGSRPTDKEACQLVMDSNKVGPDLYNKFKQDVVGKCNVKRISKVYEDYKSSMRISTSHSRYRRQRHFRSDCKAVNCGKLRSFLQDDDYLAAVINAQGIEDLVAAMACCGEDSWQIKREESSSGDGCGSVLKGIADAAGSTEKGCATLMRNPPFHWAVDEYYAEVLACCDPKGPGYRKNVDITYYDRTRVTKTSDTGDKCAAVLKGITIEGGDPVQGCTTLRNNPPFAWEEDKYYGEVMACCEGKGGGGGGICKDLEGIDEEGCESWLYWPPSLGDPKAVEKYTRVLRCCRASHKLLWTSSSSKTLISITEVRQRSSRKTISHEVRSESHTSVEEVYTSDELAGVEVTMNDCYNIFSGMKVVQTSSSPAPTLFQRCNTVLGFREKSFGEGYYHKVQKCCKEKREEWEGATSQPADCGSYLNRSEDEKRLAEAGHIVLGKDCGKAAVFAADSLRIGTELLLCCYWDGRYK